MSKRFLALLFVALLAIPAVITASASASATNSSSIDVARATKRARDWTRPLVKVRRAVGQPNPTVRSTVRFTVRFSEPVRGFSAADVKLSGTAKAKRVKVAGNRSHKAFRLTVVGARRPGILVVTVRAHAARDAAGNLSVAGNRSKVLTYKRKPRPSERRVPTPAAKPPTTTTPTTTTPTTTTPTTTTPTTSSGLIVGTIVNAAEGGSSALDPAITAGVRWAREEIWWPSIEPKQGALDWSYSDSLFLGAAQKGVHLLPLVGGIPSWAGASNKTMPSDPSAFASFVGKVTARYGPDGSFWKAHADLAQYAPVYFEIWNEPWYPFFSDPVDPARYARLFKAAAVAGRTANPAARFIIAAEWQYHAADGSWRKWVDDMYSAVPDLNSYFDAYSTHPYGNGSVDNWTPGSGDAFQTRRLEVVHDTFVARGVSDKKMWITEIGWSTCLGGDNCYTEAEQKQNLARFDELARTTWSSFVAAAFYYRLIDLNGSDRTNRELWYGVIRADGSFKPAYDVLRTIASAA